MANAVAPPRAPRLTHGLWRAASPIGLLLLWQLASVTGVLDEDTLDSPVRIAEQAWQLTRDGVLPEALLVSLRRAMLGFVVGLLVAVPLGIAAARSKIGDLIVDPPMQMLRTIPLFGLVPLFILWFGIGEQPKILLVALAAMVPVYLNLVAALRGIEPDLFEVADAFRLSRTERIRHVLIPGALPGTLVGIRQALGFAWLTLIVAEQINARSGLGQMVNSARDFQQTDTIVVGLLAYAALGLITDAVVRVLERRAMRWRDSVSTA
ncbi:MAG: ABC transporter permease [Sporichthyaceae bacterium]